MTFRCRMNSDTVDYDDACLIVRYLASMRPFAQSFDIYLTQVKWIRIPYTMILIFVILSICEVEYDVRSLLRIDILKIMKVALISVYHICLNVFVLHAFYMAIYL